MHVQPGKLQGHKTSFLNLEGFVVDCQPLAAAGKTEVSFRATVIFSDLEAADRMLLKELQACVVATPQTPPFAAKSRREMMMQRLEEVFGPN